MFLTGEAGANFLRPSSHASGAEHIEMKGNLPRALFWVAIVALLLPLVLVNYFPSCDGPAHVLNASLLDRMLLQGDVQLRYWFTLNPVVVPNWSGHLILIALLRFLPGPVAERVLIAIYVIAFLPAFRYMLRGLTRDTQGLEFLALPLVYNMHLYWGFYNFCIALVVYLLLLGLFLRSDGAWSSVRMSAFAGLAMLLYLSHGLMFLFGVLTVAILAFVRRRATFYDALRALRIPALLFLPCLLLFLDYTLFRVNRAQSILEWPAMRYSASQLFILAPLAPFRGQERYFAAAYAAFLYGLVGLRLWQLRRKWPAPELLCLALIGTLSVFVLPVAASGATMITARLVYLPVFALIGWLAASPVPIPWAWARAGVVLSIAIAFGLQFIRIPLYRAYNRDLIQIVAALAPLVHLNGVYAEDTGASVGPLTNAGTVSMPDVSPNAMGFLGVSNRAMILSNYEAHEDHFPLLFRAERDPYNHVFRYLTGPIAPPKGSLGQVDGFLFWCNSRAQGMCSTDRLGDLFQVQRLAEGPQAASWWVRTSTLSTREQH